MPRSGVLVQLRHHLAGDIMRHRHPYAGFWPQHDGSGLWPVRTWLWWTWQYITPDVATCIGGILADARQGTAIGPLQVAASRGASIPVSEKQDA